MSGLHRLIDANANRAREGLRVMEDVARFALDHAALCERIKRLRHDLAEALRSAGVDDLMLAACRDTPGDVGSAITAPSEGQRAGLREIALAASRRTGEALRLIEEALKATPVAGRSGQEGNGSPSEPAWARVESLRYRLYDAERDLILALGTGRGVPWRVCVLITESLCVRPWEDVAAGALEGGAECLQLREKSLPDGELLRRAAWLVEMARSHAGSGTVAAARPAVIINDRPDIALLAGADGVHLGQGDLPIEAVRRLAGQRLLVGVSTHSLEEARRAARAGADYCGVGAMFATGTKAREPSGPAYLRAYLADPALARIPHLAIGGITPGNIGELASIGCRGVAVSAAVCGADDPAAACRALRAALTPAGAEAR